MSEETEAQRQADRAAGKRYDTPPDPTPEEQAWLDRVARGTMDRGDTIRIWWDGPTERRFLDVTPHELLAIRGFMLGFEAKPADPARGAVLPRLQPDRPVERDIAQVAIVDDVVPIQPPRPIDQVLDRSIAKAADQAYDDHIAAQARKAEDRAQFVEPPRTGGLDEWRAREAEQARLNRLSRTRKPKALTKGERLAKLQGHTE